MEVIMPPKKIGFIGLGIMGSPMASRLLNAGYSLVVHDHHPERCQPFVEQGAILADNPARVAARCEIIISMLPDTPDVEQVVFGPAGVLEGIRPLSTYVDMSSIAPKIAQRIGAAADEAGFAALDAPVSGGDVGAKNGTLTIMVGGKQEVFDRMLPIFQAMGKNIILCGDYGAGQIVKACNQTLVGITIAGVAEALTLGAKAGVDPAVIVQVLSGGLARCGILENRGLRMVEGDFTPGFRSSLHYKDMRNVLAAGQDYAVPLPLAGLVHDLFKEMLIRERGDFDHTGLLTLVEERACIRVRKHKE
jgi:2-hydroxy-3-oxopropionate reductase